MAEWAVERRAPSPCWRRKPARCKLHTVCTIPLRLANLQAGRRLINRCQNCPDRSLYTAVYFARINFCKNITIKATSIVEPLGFSGSLPAMFLCYILCITIQANKDFLFCSVQCNVCTANRRIYSKSSQIRVHLYFRLSNRNQNSCENM